MATQVLQPFERVPGEHEYQGLFGNLSIIRQPAFVPPTAVMSACPSSCVKDDLCLYSYIPQVQKLFILEGKIGEGTFSHVYKARLKSDPTKEFAIKFLIPTSHPVRIANELKCLKDVGGSCNVVEVKMCLMHNGHVAIVMPYFPHEKFQDFVSEMTVTEVQEYMTQLLIALQRVHSFNIIHRDVKPSNFLYSREPKRFSLVDFGLAQRLCDLPKSPEPKKVVPVIKQVVFLPPGQTLAARKRPRTLDQENQTVPAAKRQCLPVVHLGPPLHAINVHNLVKVVAATTPLTAALDLAKPVLKVAPLLKVAPVLKVASVAPTPPPVQRGKTKGCNCFGKNEICNICLSRPAEVAPRAGTPGFRAPEVLMKYRGQTTAVDIWAAGVMMLCMLSGRYPFFRSQDDLTALAEIICVLGSQPVQLAAERMGKRLTLSHLKPALDLKTLCERLRGIPAGVGLESPGTDFRYHESWLHVPDSAYDLLSKLLDPDPSSRITAEDALKHDFLRQPLQ